MKIVRLVAVAALAAAAGACSSAPSPSSSSTTGDSGSSAANGGASGSSSGGSSSGGDDGGSTAGSGNGAATAPDGGTTGTNVEAGASIPANAAKIVLDVPASFSGTTRELDVVVTPTLPIAGPPAGILYQVTSPTVTPGEAMTVYGDATGISGSYYVVVVLYMQGGGEFSPAAGIDYEAQSTATFTFKGSAIDLGTLSLAVAGDGGT